MAISGQVLRAAYLNCKRLRKMQKLEGHLKQWAANDIVFP
jgi:hypothetical protein